ncbi:unnamed protein product [Zymoseptoria tritici ST99CH_1A5]|uniref:Protein kinase domain-containing protein n=1 Tax=Zymoseptoria tritici ST99CH_1A5 TaxID=1276529 RepID=A0A1Y6LA76_ZYMTR|nr:unnamed protein product [Zymoseptoria tritici ST99CH_1A5]
MRTDSKQCQIRHEAHTRASSPHRRWLRQAQQVPRSIRLCIVAVVAFCAAVGFARGLRDIQDQNKKARATSFPKSLDRSKIWSPDHPIRYNNGTHIDDKYAFFRHLGGGQEGSVDLYVDHTSGDIVVVKQMSSVARNQIPVEVSDDFLEVTTSWPTEIEAGLLLAGDVAEPYVPILDYFVVQSSTESCWAMVSPWLANGTLLNLAEKEKDQGGRTVHEIDSIYRPVVENLLQGLQSLHAKGLCHNDIQPNNIFIRDSTFWLLGDLGNQRTGECD